MNMLLVHLSRPDFDSGSIALGAVSAAKGETLIIIRRISAGGHDPHCIIAHTVPG
jgi:hypothetical protein